jgi:hypothetical protein
VVIADDVLIVLEVAVSAFDVVAKFSYWMLISYCLLADSTCSTKGQLFAVLLKAVQAELWWLGAIPGGLCTGQRAIAFAGNVQHLCPKSDQLRGSLHSYFYFHILYPHQPVLQDVLSMQQFHCLSPAQQCQAVLCLLVSSQICRKPLRLLHSSQLLGYWQSRLSAWRASASSICWLVQTGCESC